MKHTVHLEPAYVLHRRPFRETSFLVDFFTHNHGIMTAVAKGAYRNKSHIPGLLQPFLPLLISWCGRGELMTLTHVEIEAQTPALAGDALFAGLYLNELLVYLLQKWDTHPLLHRKYASTISSLKTPPLEQKTLRSFEKYLFEALGYGILANADLSLSEQLQPDHYYHFLPGMGFTRSAMHHSKTHESNFFYRKNLLAIVKEN